MTVLKPSPFGVKTSHRILNIIWQAFIIHQILSTMFLWSYLMFCDTCDQIHLEEPNTKIIIAGNISQLNIGKFMRQHGFEQMVKVPTRGRRILDVFLTTSPLLWKKRNSTPRPWYI